jgi:hypothetical protein
MLTEIIITMAVLAVIGGYIITSVLLLKFPLLLHKKKQIKFNPVHISHRGGMYCTSYFSVSSIWALCSMCLIRINKVVDIQNENEYEWMISSQIGPGQIVLSQIGPKSKRPQNESQIGHLFQIELKKCINMN